MTNEGLKIWNIFKKVIKILFAFIPLHDEVVNDNKDKTENKN